MSGRFCSSKFNEQPHTYPSAQQNQITIFNRAAEKEEQTGNSWENEIKPRSWESNENKRNQSRKALNELCFHHVTKIHR